LSHLLDSYLMGLSVAAPFGPVSLVCFSRAIRQGIGFGVVSGLGAATAHGFFAAVAYLGASAIIVLLGDIRSGLRLISATILILIGVRIICCRSCSAARPASDGVLAAYASTFFLAISNPMTILPYFALASVLATASPLYPIGSFLGALSWYVLLSVGSASLRLSVKKIAVEQLNVVTGGLLIGIGVGLACGWL